MTTSKKWFARSFAVVLLGLSIGIIVSSNRLLFWAWVGLVLVLTIRTGTWRGANLGALFRRHHE